MGENKYEGRLLNLGTIDKCHRKFAKDCKITFPDKVPVTYNFQSGIANCLGSAEIYKDDDGLRCEITLTHDDFMNSEYYVGGYYDGVKIHKEGDITVIDSCRLTYMSIVPEEFCADESLRIKRKED